MQLSQDISNSRLVAFARRTPYGDGAIILRLSESRLPKAMRSRNETPPRLIARAEGCKCNLCAEGAGYGGPLRRRRPPVRALAPNAPKAPGQMRRRRRLFGHVLID